MDPMTIWSMVKRYVAGAVVGVIVSALAAIGINAAASPELLEQIRIVVDAVLMGVFYVATIVYTRWRQKRQIDAGNVLPERIESAATAAEHGVSVK